MQLSEIIGACSEARGEFEAMAPSFPYEPKGIFNSEMLLVCAISQYLSVPFVIETGRARGNSTEILAMYFQNVGDTQIVSLEHRPYTEDSIECQRRLGTRFGNLELVHGDALSFLPELVEDRCPSTVVIDGPKGRYAVGLAARLLASSDVRAVFIHDLPRGDRARQALEFVFPKVFFTDNEEYVAAFSHLDDRNWEIYQDLNGEENWAPYRRRGKTAESYGPTLGMVLAEQGPIDRVDEIMEQLDLARADVFPSPWIRTLRRIRTHVPVPSEIGTFIGYWWTRFMTSFHERAGQYRRE